MRILNEPLAHQANAEDDKWVSPNTCESTVRYLGIEVDDALEMAEQTEV